MSSKQSKEENTMNMFAKRTPSAPKNAVPLTLAMIDQIDPNTKKLDGIIEVTKAVIQVIVKGINHRMGGKIEIEVKDLDETKQGLVHMYKPKFAQQENDFVIGDMYTFVCLVKADHGEIVLMGVTCKKVRSQEEVNCHHYKITLADLYRQKMRIDMEKEIGSVGKGNEYNEFDI